MPRRFGVLANYDHPEPKSFVPSRSPMQARLAPMFFAGGEPRAELTPDELTSLDADRRDAAYSAARARLDIAKLLKDRELGFRSPASILTEQRAEHYYDSASDSTLRAVDQRLASLEPFLQEPVRGATRRYTYRPLTQHEIREQAKAGKPFAAVYTADHRDSVGVNYPVYRNLSRSERTVTQLHEWLHRAGVTQGEKKELYDKDALEEARKAGGTNWPLNKNAENTALFAGRPWWGATLSARPDQPVINRP